MSTVARLKGFLPLSLMLHHWAAEAFKASQGLSSRFNHSLNVKMLGLGAKPELPSFLTSPSSGLPHSCSSLFSVFLSHHQQILSEIKQTNPPSAHLSSPLQGPNVSQSGNFKELRIKPRIRSHLSKNSTVHYWCVFPSSTFAITPTSTWNQMKHICSFMVLTGSCLMNSLSDG